MNGNDALIGRNVAAYRGDRSQSEIASAMKSRGWKWAQNTVSAVEAGERPLRLAEAVDLAQILGARDAHDLARETELASFSKAVERMRAAHDALTEAVQDYALAQNVLAVAGEQALAAGANPDNGVAGVLEAFLTQGVVDAVRLAAYGDPPSDEDIARMRANNELPGSEARWFNTLVETNVRERRASVQHPEAS
jgi:hypothetical protein